jgi:hypothetical protein
VHLATSLTAAPRTFHDGFVRRLLFLVLVIVAVLWLPARHAGAGERRTSLPLTEGSAQTGQPRQPADCSPQMIAGTAGTWQARSAHDVLAFETASPRLADFSLATSVSPARFRLHQAPPLRTFPLLI